MTCPGGADAPYLTRMPDGFVRWSSYPPMIHVHIDVVNDPESWAEVSKWYDLGEPCPDYPAFVAHCHRKEPTRYVPV